MSPPEPRFAQPRGRRSPAATSSRLHADPHAGPGSGRQIRRCALAVALALLLARPGFAQPPAPPPAVDETDALLLAVVVDRQPVSEGLTGYQAGDDVLLPLGQLASALTLAIGTTPERASASGYILDESRTFELDAARSTVILAGRSEQLDPAAVSVQPDDIYVSARLLARWLPIDLDVDLSTLTVTARPRERLPLQLRLERERRSESLATAAQPAGPALPRHEIPYQRFSTPFIDQTLVLDYRGGSGHSGYNGRYTAYATGDLLGLQAALYLNLATSTADDARLTVGRHDPDARLLGPLRARSALIGSVAVPAMPHITRHSATGEGFVLSNRPLSQPDSFGVHSLQGPLPPGWDVELYSNDVLVGLQSSGPEGQYRFENLPLMFGPNEFRLVFHGPLGEVRVERESFLLEQSLTPAGEFRYHVAQHRDEEGHARLHAQFDWGLGRHLGASGGVLRAPVSGTPHNYRNLALRAHWRSLIVGGGMTRSDDGGSLAEATLRTRLGQWALTAGHARLQDFTSEIYAASADPVRTGSSVRIDGTVGLPRDWPRLQVMVDARSERRASGMRDLDIATRIGSNLRATSLSGQFRWQRLAGQRLADATFQASRRWGGTSVRGQVNYRIEPEREPSAISVTVDRRWRDNYLQSLSVTRFFDSAQTLYTAGLSRTLGRFGFSFNAGFSSHGDAAASLQLFMAAAREPRSSRWSTSALPVANTGAVSARVFLDADMDGLMDADEMPIAGVGFEIDGGRPPARTDASGVVHLERLPVLRPSDIAIVPETLEDPQLAPARPGVSIVPRAGSVAALEFPVISTSEIEGTVRVTGDAGPRAAANLRIEAVDADGRIVASTVTAADGYYVLTGIPAGAFRIRLASDQRPELEGSRERTVEVERDDWLVSGIDFELRSAR